MLRRIRKFPLTAAGIGALLLTRLPSIALAQPTPAGAPPAASAGSVPTAAPEGVNVATLSRGAGAASVANGTAH